MSIWFSKGYEKSSRAELTRNECYTLEPFAFILGVRAVPKPIKVRQFNAPDFSVGVFAIPQRTTLLEQIVSIEKAT